MHFGALRNSGNLEDIKNSYHWVGVAGLVVKNRACGKLCGHPAALDFALRVQLPQAVGGVQLQQLAGYVIARHPSAFTLAWDGASAVYVKMSPEFLGWTHGLCGNNNADPQDDLVTSYGESKGRYLVGYFAGDGVWVRIRGEVALASPLMSWLFMVRKTQMGG